MDMNKDPNELFEEDLEDKRGGAPYTQEQLDAMMEELKKSREGLSEKELEGVEAGKPYTMNDNHSYH